MMVSPDAPRPPHTCTRHPAGTYACYERHGCRCRACADVRSRYVKRRAHNLPTDTDKRVDGTGTRRRLQALARIGWSSADIAKRIGSHESAVRRIRSGGYVMASTAAQINTVFSDLAMQIPPTTPYTKRASILATRAGWPPPLAWGDDIDNPAAIPDLGKVAAMSSAEKVAEARMLLGTDTTESIARRLGYGAPKNLAKAFRRIGDHDTANRIERAKEVA